MSPQAAPLVNQPPGSVMEWCATKISFYFFTARLSIITKELSHECEYLCFLIDRNENGLFFVEKICVIPDIAKTLKE